MSLRPLGNLDPLVRAQLFFLVCIPVRLALYSLVFIGKDNIYMPHVVGLFALLSVIHLARSPFDVGQWWSRRFQLFMAVSVLLACILVAYTRKYTLLVPVLLYTSLIGGILQRAVFVVNTGSLVEKSSR